MNSFAQWLWLMVWWFLFIAYLIVLFQIISDLFRDRELSGWAKAAWTLGLIVIPYFVALIYVIARGRGMADRRARDYYQAQERQDEYIRSVATGPSPATQISTAKALLDQGAITQAEFDALKARALA
jgi:hypothetical protein